MSQSDTDRIAGLEVSVRVLQQAVRDLLEVAERVSDVPADYSPAQRRDFAARQARMAQLEAQARQHQTAQEVAAARAAAEHVLSIMVRIEGDPHVQTAQQRLDHLETARPSDVSPLDWARDRAQPETGCCGGCCPSNHHDHSSRSTWDPTTLAAEWTQIRTRYQEASRP